MKNVVSKKSNRRASLFARVVALIEEARQKVASVANLAQVYTNYEIGRQIVEEEQGGKRRAEYGKQVLIDLSQKLTARFGRGWSVDNLEKMRRFFLLYSHVEISAKPLRISNGEDLATTSRHFPQFTLGWSHYLLLMRISDTVEYPRRKESRWGVRCGTIDVRRREARDVRRVSCLLSRVKNSSRLGFNVSRPAKTKRSPHL